MHTDGGCAVAKESAHLSELRRIRQHSHCIERPGPKCMHLPTKINLHSGDRNIDSTRTEPSETTTPEGTKGDDLVIQRQILYRFTDLHTVAVPQHPSRLRRAAH